MIKEYSERNLKIRILLKIWLVQFLTNYVTFGSCDYWPTGQHKDVYHRGGIEPTSGSHTCDSKCLAPLGLAVGNRSDGIRDHWGSVGSVLLSEIDRYSFDNVPGPQSGGSLWLLMGAPPTWLAKIILYFLLLSGMTPPQAKQLHASFSI